MKRDLSASKRSVKVCDPVRGVVSPADIRAWLLATGWRLKPNRFFTRGKALARCPEDDETGAELGRLIADIAARTKRSPGDILRAIVAHARKR